MYVKIFHDLLQSSLWAEDDKTRLVWITMLIMADQDGLVHATAPGISHLARVSAKATDAALAKLEGADPNSRTPDNEGRRIERVDGGYLILNYSQYRALATRQHEREQTRKRVTAYRTRKRTRNGIVTPRNAPVTLAVADAVAVADAEANSKEVQLDTMILISPKNPCSERKKASDSELTAPPELVGLSLYELDKKLIKAWPNLLKAATQAYPGVDIVSEVKKAHAWEVANRTKRKKNRPRFLHNWFAKAQDAPSAERQVRGGFTI